jgi:hypothetical protein
MPDELRPETRAKCEAARVAVQAAAEALVADPASNWPWTEYASHGPSLVGDEGVYEVSARWRLPQPEGE